MKNYNSEFDEIIIKFTDQNGLEIEDKVNLTLPMTPSSSLATR